MIRIVSGWSGPGGSTLSNIALCNLFNAHGLDCVFYGKQDYHLTRCRAGRSADFRCEPDDRLIVHFTRWTERPAARRVVLSCHEKDLFRVRSLRARFWDVVHFVSASQRTWQRAAPPSVVIPVLVPELRAKPRSRAETAGVIGSIDAVKQTHVSIKRALEQGFARVLVYGRISEVAYYRAEVKPLRRDPRVRLMGHCDDRQAMYDSIDVVFHSSRSETFNLVRVECERAGVRYEGLASADTDAEHWAPERILAAWKDCLQVH
jgi:hypothetical protein